MKIEDSKIIIEDIEEQRIICWALAEYCGTYHKDNKKAVSMLDSIREYMNTTIFKQCK